MNLVDVGALNRARQREAAGATAFCSTCAHDRCLLLALAARGGGRSGTKRFPLLHSGSFICSRSSRATVVVFASVGVQRTERVIIEKKEPGSLVRAAVAKDTDFPLNRIVDDLDDSGGAAGAFADKL